MIARVSHKDFGLPAGRGMVAGVIADALERDGVFYLNNHDIPNAVIERTYDAGRRLHDLGIEQKQHLAVGTNGLARGWHRGVSAGKGTYESYEIGTEAAPGSGGDPTGILHGPNIWPELDGFRDDARAYFDAMRGLGRDLASITEEALGLPADYLRARARLPCCTLRMLHYETSEASEAQLGIEPHTDFELFTIISERAPGLEVCDRHGDWGSIAARSPRELLIMGGDLLEIITGGRVESPLHRVRVTPHERQSLAFFYGLDADADVSPQLSRATDATSHTYGPIRVCEHLASMQILSYPHLRERHEAGDLLSELSVPSSNPFKAYKIARGLRG